MPNLKSRAKKERTPRMIDVDFLKAQIQEMNNQEQIHFANWQRVQGAKAAYTQMLAEMEKDAEDGQKSNTPKEGE